METRHISDAISLLSRLEMFVTNRARTNDEYKLARTIRTTVKEAGNELAKAQQQPAEKIVYVGEDLQSPLECYCNADNAPCNWCQHHCAECSEQLDDCVCA